MSLGSETLFSHGVTGVPRPSIAPETVTPELYTRDMYAADMVSLSPNPTLQRIRHGSSKPRALTSPTSKVVINGSGDEGEKRDALKILPLRKHGNLLL